MSEAERASPKSFMELINAVDNVPRPWDFSKSPLYTLLLPNDSRPYGFIPPSVVSQMPWSPEFQISHSTRTIQLIDSSAGEDTASACNAAFQATIDAAISQDVFPVLHRTHSEPYLIPGTRYGANVILERFAAPLFGILSRGAHMTAYVRTKDAQGREDMRIWVARRSRSLFTYPGMLDTTVAGGVKASDTPRQCIIEEADEEASLPAAFVEAHSPSSDHYVSYIHEKAKVGYVSPTMLYCFDLDMTNEEGMEPKPRDDEVEGFELMNVDEIVEKMRGGEFKPNCNLVMLDFFIRHGILKSETGGEGGNIEKRLRRELPVPI